MNLPAQNKLDKEEDILLYYQSHPIEYMTQILDVNPAYVWDKMVEIANSVRDNQFTCIKAGNSLSKSYTMGRIAAWFLLNHYPSTVVTTAPSNIQVEEILWREIRSCIAGAKVPIGAEPMKTSLDLQTTFKTTDKWFATGFATKPDNVSQHVTRFQGFHNKYVLIIFDEAAGIIPEIWEAKDRLITNKNCKFVAIGNPTSARGPFVDCFKDSRYNKITVSVFDSPNYKQGKEVIPGLSGREFEEQVRLKYKEHSNQYKSMITGEIPDEDVDSLIPISWIERAELREVEFPFNSVRRFLTWDVADGGDDLHVIKAWENTTEIDSLEIRGKKVEEVEPYVWRLLRKIGGNAIIVDGDGIGRVAIGLLESTRDSKTTIIPFIGSDRDSVYDPDIFFNRRHEAHWKMRELFEKDKISISKNEEQREELAAIKLVDHTKGFISVEKKKDLKERLGRSPDRADAIMMMAGAFEEVPILHKGGKKFKQFLKELNPYPFNPMTV